MIRQDQVQGKTLPNDWKFHHPFPCSLASDEDDTVVDVAGKVQRALHVLPFRDTLQEPDPSCRAFGYSRRNKLFRAGLLQ